MTILMIHFILKEHGIILIFSSFHYFDRRLLPKYTGWKWLFTYDNTYLFSSFLLQ